MNDGGLASSPDVIIGTPVYSAGAYVLDKFLANQREIQESYPASRLVLATAEPGFVRQLEDLVESYQLRGVVFPYEVIRPEHACHEIWNITSGREAIRKYTVNQTGAEHLLFLDADMTCDPAVVDIMLRLSRGYDVVFSGYPLRSQGIGLMCAGCVLLCRRVLAELNIRCYEFANGDIIFEDNMLEYDLYRMGARVRKGYFVAIDHYVTTDEVRCITPRPVGLLRRASNFWLVRYVLLWLSIICRRNLAKRIKVFLNRFVRV